MIEKEKNPEKKEYTEADLSYLTPRDTIHITGKISYKERMKSFALIQLRKELINIFPQLKERRGNFAYTMYYNRSPKEVRKILDGLEKKELTPILLLLGRVKENKPPG